jgi:hypothetical protein
MTISIEDLLPAIRDEVTNAIKDNLGSEIQLIDKYRGEFEQNSEWNPRDTACFLQVINYRPTEEFANDDIAVLKCRIRVYAGAIVKHGQDALSLVAKLIELFNASDLDFTVTKGTDTEAFSMKISISNEGMDFIIYKLGFEAYTFIIEIDGPAHSGIAIPVPDAVNLTSPTNGAVDINPSDADLSWQTVAGMTYQLQVSGAADFSNIIFDQDKIKYNNFTLPDGILSSNETYYWRVRAYNSNDVCGAWGSRSFTTVSTSIEPETTALIARFTQQPSSDIIADLDIRIKALKSTGLWNKLDRYYNFAIGTNATDALLDWKGGPSASLVGSHTWIAYQGFKSDVGDANHYINLNFTPSIHGVQYTLNNNTQGFYSRNANYDSGYDGLKNLDGTAPVTNLSPNFGGASIGYGNNQAASTYSQSVSTMKGCFINTRTASNAIKIYNWGENDFSSATNPTALTNTSLILSGKTRLEYSQAWVGAGFTDADAFNMKQMIQDYMRAHGKDV